MCAFIICFLLMILEAISAPTETVFETTDNYQIDANTEKYQEGENKALGDTPQTSEEKNPVQQWFESLSKNATEGTQNAFNNIKDWFTKISNNAANPGAMSNLPVMYMGSFQLLKMPMPQLGDVIKGMGDLATAAQTVNKVVGGGGLPIPGLG